jgi:hypothetical protein
MELDHFLRRDPMIFRHLLQIRTIGITIDNWDARQFGLWKRGLLKPFLYPV